MLVASLGCLLFGSPVAAPDPFDPALSRPLTPAEQERRARREVDRRIEARAQKLGARQGWRVKREWDEFGSGRFFDHAVTDSANKVTSGWALLGIGLAINAVGAGLLIAGSNAEGDYEGLPQIIGGAILLAPGVALWVSGAARVGIHRDRLYDLRRIEREERSVGATARLRFRGLAPLYVPGLGAGGLTLRLGF